MVKRRQVEPTGVDERRSKRAKTSRRQVTASSPTGVSSAGDDPRDNTSTASGSKEPNHDAAEASPMGRARSAPLPERHAVGPSRGRAACRAAHRTRKRSRSSHSGSSPLNSLAAEDGRGPVSSGTGAASSSSSSASTTSRATSGSETSGVSSGTVGTESFHASSLDEKTDSDASCHMSDEEGRQWRSLACRRREQERLEGHMREAQRLQRCVRRSLVLRDRDSDPGLSLRALALAHPASVLLAVRTFKEAALDRHMLEGLVDAVASQRMQPAQEGDSGSGSGSGSEGSATTPSASADATRAPGSGTHGGSGSRGCTGPSSSTSDAGEAGEAGEVCRRHHGAGSSFARPGSHRRDRRRPSARMVSGEVVELFPGRGVGEFFLDQARAVALKLVTVLKLSEAGAAHGGLLNRGAVAAMARTGAAYARIRLGRGMPAEPDVDEARAQVLKEQKAAAYRVERERRRLVEALDRVRRAILLREGGGGQLRPNDQLAIAALTARAADDQAGLLTAVERLAQVLPLAKAEISAGSDAARNGGVSGTEPTAAQGQHRGTGAAPAAAVAPPSGSGARALAAADFDLVASTLQVVRAWRTRQRHQQQQHQQQPQVGDVEVLLTSSQQQLLSRTLRALLRQLMVWLRAQPVFRDPYKRDWVIALVRDELGLETAPPQPVAAGPGVEVLRTASFAQAYCHGLRAHAVGRLSYHWGMWAWQELRWLHVAQSKNKPWMQLVRRLGLLQAIAWAARLAFPTGLLLRGPTLKIRMTADRTASLRPDRLRESCVGSLTMASDITELTGFVLDGRSYLPLASAVTMADAREDDDAQGGEAGPGSKGPGVEGGSSTTRAPPPPSRLYFTAGRLTSSADLTVQLWCAALPAAALTAAAPASSIQTAVGGLPAAPPLRVGRSPEAAAEAVDLTLMALRGPVAAAEQPSPGPPAAVGLGLNLGLEYFALDVEVLLPARGTELTARLAAIRHSLAPTAVTANAIQGATAASDAPSRPERGMLRLRFGCGACAACRDPIAAYPCLRPAAALSIRNRERESLHQEREYLIRSCLGWDMKATYAEAAAAAAADAAAFSMHPMTGRSLSRRAVEAGAEGAARRPGGGLGQDADPLLRQRRWQRGDLSAGEDGYGDGRKRRRHSSDLVEGPEPELELVGGASAGPGPASGRGAAESPPGGHVGSPPKAPPAATGKAAGRTGGQDGRGGDRRRRTAGGAGQQPGVRGASRGGSGSAKPGVAPGRWLPLPAPLWALVRPAAARAAAATKRKHEAAAVPQTFEQLPTADCARKSPRRPPAPPTRAPAPPESPMGGSSGAGTAEPHCSRPRPSRRRRAVMGPSDGDVIKACDRQQEDLKALDGLTLEGEAAPEYGFLYTAHEARQSEVRFLDKREVARALSSVADVARVRLSGRARDLQEARSLVPYVLQGVAASTNAPARATAGGPVPALAGAPAFVHQLPGVLLWSPAVLAVPPLLTVRAAVTARAAGMSDVALLPQLKGAKINELACRWCGGVDHVSCGACPLRRLCAPPLDVRRAQPAPQMLSRPPSPSPSQTAKALWGAPLAPQGGQQARGPLWPLPTEPLPARQLMLPKVSPYLPPVGVIRCTQPRAFHHYSCLLGGGEVEPGVRERSWDGTVAALPRHLETRDLQRVATQERREDTLAQAGERRDSLGRAADPPLPSWLASVERTTLDIMAALSAAHPWANGLQPVLRAVSTLDAAATTLVGHPSASQFRPWLPSWSSTRWVPQASPEPLSWEVLLALALLVEEAARAGCE